MATSKDTYPLGRTVEPSGDFDIAQAKHIGLSSGKNVEQAIQELGETMPLDEVDRICAEAWGVSPDEFK